MPIVLNWKQIKAQSDAVFNQFGESVWIPNARINVKLPRKDTGIFHNIGVGRHLACCALGESMEEKAEILKKYRNRVDIVTCDKGFRALLAHGIKADYVILCDSNIVFDKWMGDAIKETKGVKLLATPYANTDWTTRWRGDRYFFINEDAINTHAIFLNIFGDGVRTIPAGSNVSNAMVIFFVGANNGLNINYSGYEKYLLVGYDYSWRPDGNYYAWTNPVPKRYYMNHRTMLDVNNDVIFTSENLLFSAKWLYSYVTTFNLPVLNCSGRGLLDIYKADFEEELQSIQRNAIGKCRSKFYKMKKLHNKFNFAKQEFEKARMKLNDYNKGG